jgi:hypothetical protein
MQRREEAIMAQQGNKNKDLPDIPQADAYTDVSEDAENLAETSGQNEDMRRTTSDDGTIPPTAAREAITTGVDPARVNTPAGAGYVKANPGLPSNIRVAEPPEGATKDSGPERGDPSTAPSAGNPVTLSPADPRRESDEGQPYLDDANPFGRALPNQEDRPLGGAGTWKDPQKRVSHEQPGADAANPLPQALDAQPHRSPES